MKKPIIILIFLHITLITSAQTFQSNQVSNFSGLYEQIDFYDEEDCTIVSIAPKFYKHHNLKKKIKPIKIEGQTYFIKIEKFGLQSVYTVSGEHIADMDKSGTKIHLLQDDISYYLKPKLRSTNGNVLECYNSEGTLVSKTSWINNKRLTYDNKMVQSPNFLLMSLCAHQYQELLLGNRGRLTAVTF